MPNSLLWFRNDLRIENNQALAHFLSITDSNRTAHAIFFVSIKQWKLHDWSDIKIDFIKRHALYLKQQLLTLNIDLQIIKADTFADQINYLLNNNQFNHVIANGEIEINERQRDHFLIDSGLNLQLFESDVIVPKGKLLTSAGQMYKVFTPFKKAWLSYVREKGVAVLTSIDKSVTNTPVKNIPCLENASSKNWPLVEQFKSQQLALFFKSKIYNYQVQRDFPALNSTSQASPYLAAGVLSPVYLLQRLLHLYPDCLYETETSHFSWLNELIWREFYRHLYFAHPRLCKSQSFNLKYQELNWPNNKNYFQLWCNAKTGYPLVDAAILQLKQTGWMHNRLRMVVASFLTKHLLVDWRLGERFFMQHLIDGDLAANNGGWQWAASTGCDAQPYFRVFNPITQSQRFDPNGEFIRKYIPELKDIPDKHIHFPHQYMKENGLQGYWPAIVEHKQARLAAIDFYR